MSVSISAETGVDQPVLGGVVGHQQSMEVASGGALYLAVWSTLRAGRSHIYAARVTPAGQVLDPYGLRLAEGINPSVAAAGGVFLVTYQAHNAERDRFDELRGVRVSAGGVVLDPAAIDIGTGGAYPRVSFDGVHFATFWGEGKTIYRARITTQGTVLDPDGTAIYTNPAVSQLSTPRVACVQERCVLAWHEPRSLRSAVIDAQGAVVGPGVHVLDSYASGDDWRLAGLNASFDGTHYVVAWSGGRDQDSDVAARERAAGAPTAAPAQLRQGLRARRLDQQGALVDADVIMLASSPMNVLGMAFDGINTVMVTTTWNYCDQPLYLVRLSPAGEAVDASPHLLSEGGSGMAAAVAANGARTLVVFHTHGPPAPSALHTALLSGGLLAPAGTGFEGEVFAIETAANGQALPSVSFDGQNYLLTWRDHRRDSTGSFTSLYGARMTPAGEVLDLNGIELAAQRDFIFQPRSVFDGQNTVLLWGEEEPACHDTERQLLARRVSPAGVVQGQGIDHLYTETWTVYGVAAGSQGILVALDDYDYDVGSDVVRLVHMSQAGVVTELPALVLAELGVSSLYDLKLASQGLGYLLVIHDGAAQYTGGPTIVGLRLDSQGMLLDPGLIPLGQHGSPLAASFDGEHYVVATSDQGLRVTRVTPDGQVLDAQGVAVTGAGAPCASHTLVYAATMAAAGTSTMIAWQGRTSTAEPYRVHGATLASDGTVRTCFAISEDEVHEGSLALASAGQDKAVIAYTRFVAGAPLDNRRVRVRHIDESPDASEPDAGPDMGSDAGPDMGSDAGPASPGQDPGPAEPPVPGAGPGEQSAQGCQAAHTASGQATWLIMLLVCLAGLGLPRYRS